MKTEAGDVTLIAVGGGAFLVPDRLAGISEVVPRPARRLRQRRRRRDRADQLRSVRPVAQGKARAAGEGPAGGVRLFLRAIKKKGGVWPSLIASTCGL